MIKTSDNLIRLYYKDLLNLNHNIQLPDNHHRYLHKVMRLKTGDQFKIFNERDGEFLATFAQIDKKSSKAFLELLIKVPNENKKLSLAFSVLKNPNTNLVIQKATELGVGKIFPLLTERSVVKDVNSEKLNLIAIEATEQCESLLPPSISALQTLRNFLTTKPFEGKLIFCYEREKVLSLIKGISSLVDDENTILVGPEGGFSMKEIELIKSFDYVISVSLGSRILRAETAVIAATSIYQAVREK